MACSRCGKKTAANSQPNPKLGSSYHPAANNSAVTNSTPSSKSSSVKEVIQGLKYVPTGK